VEQLSENYTAEILEKGKSGKEKMLDVIRHGHAATPGSSRGNALGIPRQGDQTWISQPHRFGENSCGRFFHQ